ncbi:AmpG family muropeptide MFS transporter [Sphingomonas abietis]|uniref:MFS transporter n=1 Tax=Sphingomonas abietis TaxID=3012344 RepID=A0ABY7NIA0_9SPHN|nr:MFS transporter [Sphingomonas abietis]WBO21199.1 MFS transporter [Sphingomonas abietis]
MAVERPKGFRLLAVALKTRKSASMLAFGFSSGLPYALLIGTLNAWLGEVKISLATIGILSWIGLAYAFKFLWSPVVDRLVLPGLGRLGRRKSWITLCQIVMVFAFIGLAFTDPAKDIGTFAIFAVIAALGSATQDVAVDAWRIDVADEMTPVELLSAIYQFGYRIASIVGGAFALFLAARMSWTLVFLIMACFIALMIGVALFAPDTERPPESRNGALSDHELAPGLRFAALAVVGISWIWAIASIGHFMVTMLMPVPAGTIAPSVAGFMKTTGPWIIIATVLVPLMVAAMVNRLKDRMTADTARSVGGAADHLYGALISPLTELTARLGWGVLGVMGLILTYTLCYNIWAAFAYPFYLDFLHYSKDEVAFASKLFGIVMTIVGVGLGGILFARLGRFPTVLIGAILPILGNFLYADLADGAVGIDAFAHLLRLDALAAMLGSDERMMRLLIVISAENVSTGIAGAAFVAYVSGIVAKRYAAVQYSLLSSLTFLIGSLARGVAGEAFDRLGYATVFRQTALVGLLAILFVLAEWWRSSRQARREAGNTGLAA